MHRGEEGAIEAEWDELPDEGPIFAGQCLRQTLKRACKVAGVEHIPPYGTRHTFISRWLQEGRSRDALIKIVGHVDGKMIDRVYAHFGAPELADHLARVGWGREADVIPLRARKEG